MQSSTLNIKTRCEGIIPYVSLSIDRQINRQIDRQIDGQIDRQIDRQIDQRPMILFLLGANVLFLNKLHLSKFWPAKHDNIHPDINSNINNKHISYIYTPTLCFIIYKLNYPAWPVWNPRNRSTLHYNIITSCAEHLRDLVGFRQSYIHITLSSRM